MLLNKEKIFAEFDEESMSSTKEVIPMRNDKCDVYAQEEKKSAHSNECIRSLEKIFFFTQQ